MEVHQNIVKTRSVCCRLVKLMGWEGEGGKLSALFYRALIKAVLMFGLESWELFDAIISILESTHEGFLFSVSQGSGQDGNPTGHRRHQQPRQ